MKVHLYSVVAGKLLAGNSLAIEPSVHLKKAYRKSLLITLLLIGLSCLFFSSISYSQYGGEQHNATHAEYLSSIPFDEVKSGSLFYKSEHGYKASLAQQSDFNIDVNGLVARIDVKQSFINSSGEWLEAVYVFPLPESAAVDRMKMHIGERVVIGKIKEKQQAKKLYQAAKKQGKKASLVSQQRPNMFTTKVANIAPNETVTIEISYLQPVHFQAQEFSLRLPLTITPRFVAKQQAMSVSKIAQKPNISASTEVVEGAENIIESGVEVDAEGGADTFVIENEIHLNTSNGWAVADADEISPPQKYYQRSNQENARTEQIATISATIAMGLPITNLTSLYHSVNKQQVPLNKQQEINQQVASIKLSLVEPSVALDRDFVLTWQVKPSHQPQAAFFKTTKNNADYGLLMVVPPKAESLAPINKDVVIVIDVSGSMGGVSIKQAKRALAYALTKLSNKDSFNIVAFNDQAKPLFTHSQPVNIENIAWAQQWLSGLRAGGGTNMYPALALALANSAQSHAYRQVIFVTDGAVGDEANLFTLIENQLADTRLHTVGIGSAPNSYFMSQAAKIGRGSYRYIGDINEVHQQMNRLFDDISQPMLSNISLSWQGEKDLNQQLEFYPSIIPDLYASQPLLVTVRLPKNSLKQLSVKGELNQQPWEKNINISQAKQQSGIASLWARSKITQLSQDLRRSKNSVDKNQTEQLKKNITELALAHQLVSKYTSFVAIEEKPSRAQTSALKRRKIANAMPHGSQQKIALANTALGIDSFILYGFILLACALFLHLASAWLVRGNGLNQHQLSSRE